MIIVTTITIITAATATATATDTTTTMADMDKALAVAAIRAVTVAATTDHKQFEIVNGKEFTSLLVNQVYQRKNVNNANDFKSIYFNLFANKST